MQERLDKFVSSQTEYSRSQVKILVKKGEITVNGKIPKTSDIKIDINGDTVLVKGVKINYKKNIYLMLNKPKGVVCSTKDERSANSVLSLVPDEFKRDGLFPAGRLDKDTEGFVLITDDGEFAHKMLSPKSHVPKVYYAELLKDYEQSYEEAFRSGMEIDGGDVCLPAEIYFHKQKDNAVFVVLHEGMYHQVKRMFKALGNEVVYLKRLQIGGLILDQNLAMGECREILHKETLKIWTFNDFLDNCFSSLVKFSSK